MAEEYNKCNCEGWFKNVGYLPKVRTIFYYCPWCGKAMLLHEPPLTQGELRGVRALLDNPIKAMFSRYDVTGGTDLMGIIRHEVGQ